MKSVEEDAGDMDFNPIFTLGLSVGTAVTLRSKPMRIY